MSRTKLDKFDIKSVKKLGGSAIITLTGFVKCGEQFKVNRNNDVVTLTKIPQNPMEELIIQQDRHDDCNFFVDKNYHVKCEGCGNEVLNVKETKDTIRKFGFDTLMGTVNNSIHDNLDHSGCKGYLMVEIDKKSDTEKEEKENKFDKKSETEKEEKENKSEPEKEDEDDNFY